MCSFLYHWECYFCFVFSFLAIVRLGFIVLNEASFPHFNIYIHLLTGFNRHTIKYLVCRALFCSFWCDLQTVSYTSDPSMSINPLFQLVKVFPSTLPHLSSTTSTLSLYPGSTFALCLLTFALQDVLIISSKNTISVYSTEQKI